MKQNSISEKSIERIVLYNRILLSLRLQKLDYIYSHQLATIANNTPAQLRRDLMTIGYFASSKKGYEIDGLIAAISDYLDLSNDKKIAVIGIGNLGKAILAYFKNQPTGMSIGAAFDVDYEKVNRVYSGFRCFHIDELSLKVKEMGISLAIITVPSDEAQQICDKLIDAGIKGVMNMAPVPLKVPDYIRLERVDLIAKLEKLAFLSNK